MKTLEKGIIPLVDALNDIEGLKTRYSCHGHVRDPRAWVIFSSLDVELPYQFCEKLRAVAENHSYPFRHLWTIRPWFHLYDQLPGFIIEGRPVGHFGLLLRKYLSEETIKLKELLFIDGNEHQNPDNGCKENNEVPISVDPSSPRVFRLAAGAPVVIRGNRFTTPVTFNELCHEVLYQMAFQKARNGNKALISITSPLNHSLYLWHLISTLRGMEHEDAFGRRFETEGHFIGNRHVILNIRCC